MDLVQVTSVCCKCGESFVTATTPNNVACPKKYPRVCYNCQRNRINKEQKLRRSYLKEKGLSSSDILGFRSTGYKSAEVKARKAKKNKKPKNVSISSAEFNKKYIRFCKKHGIEIQEEQHPVVNESFSKYYHEQIRQSVRHFEDITNKYVNASAIDAARRERYQKKKEAEQNGQHL